MTEFLQQCWSRNLHQQPNPWSIIDPALVVVSERLTWLARIDPTTGAVRWRISTGSTWGWMACTAQQVFHLESYIQCFDRETGELRWQHVPADHYIGAYGNLAVGASGVLIGGWRGYRPLRCLDAATGELRWVYPETRYMLSPLLGPWGIAVADVGIGIGETQAPKLLLLDDDGRVWRTLRIPDQMLYADRDASLQIYGEYLIVATHDGGVFALNPLGDDDWTQIGAHPAGIATSTPLRSGDTLLFQDGAGQICAFDLRAGLPRWVMEPILYNRSDVVAVELPGGRWIVRTNIGEVSLLDPDGAVLARQTIAQRISTPLALTANGLIVAGTKSTLAGYQLSDPAG